MTADELIAALQALPAEQRKLPVLYEGCLEVETASVVWRGNGEITRQVIELEGRVR